MFLKSYLLVDKIGLTYYSKINGLEDFTNSWDFFNEEFIEYIDSQSFMQSVERDELMHFRGISWGGIRLPKGHDKFILCKFMIGSKLNIFIFLIFVIMKCYVF